MGPMRESLCPNEETDTTIRGRSLGNFSMTIFGLVINAVVGLCDSAYSPINARESVKAPSVYRSRLVNDCIEEKEVLHCHYCKIFKY